MTYQEIANVLVDIHKEEIETALRSENKRNFEACMDRLCDIATEIRKFIEYTGGVCYNKDAGPA